MKAVNFVLALLVSLLIALGVFEGGLRLIGRGPEVRINTFDPTTGWTNKPNTNLSTPTPDGATVHFSFNAHGLREGDDVVPAKPAGTRRLVALGDSFTLGRTVEQEELFLDRLEALWSGGGHELQVVNTGREGWSTDQQVAWLLEHGDEWRPDVVLLFAYENDFYWCGETEYPPNYAKPRFSAAGELEAGELENRMTKGWFASTAIGNLFAKEPEAPKFRFGSREIPKEFGIVLDELPDFMTDALARAEGAIRALDAKCDELGAELVIVPIPSEAVIHEKEREKYEGFLGKTGWSGDHSIERLFALCRSANIPDERLLDVRDHFHARARAGDVLYFERDWHLNPKGNEELAVFLAAELGRLGLTPDMGGAPLPALPDPGGVPGWLPWYLGLWALLGTCYAVVYRKTEKPALGFVKVGALLAVIFFIAVGGLWVIDQFSPRTGQILFILVVLAILGFVAYKLGDRLGTITELMAAFIGRGHWYLMPLVTVLLTVGSLLVVAASSPLVAPFIYTLF